MDHRNRLLLASVVAIATTSFGFVVRSFLITEWGTLYNLTETQKGALSGAGLFPFALSIILVSLLVDRIGYERAMAAAWIGHVSSALITMSAHSYEQIYLGTILFALSNGVVEAVTNPAVATLYADDKVRRLNVLHAGWPAGLVFGGLLFIAMGSASWQLKIGLFLLPALLYGVLMLGCRFPVQERVRAGVSYREMLEEFGWAGCLIVCYFVAGAIDAVLAGVFRSGLSTGLYWAITLLPTIAFAVQVRRAGRPVFIFMLLIMLVLATTELGTDSWVTDLLRPALGGSGEWVLVYTSAVMFALRLLAAGPLVRALTPVGLLLAGSCLAALGLVMIAHAGAAAGLVFLAATLYAAGKCFLWPTTLGIVSEQFPKGGALTLNAMGGMGMIAVGVLGAPFLGAIVDQNLDRSLRAEQPAIHAQLAEPAQSFPLLRGLNTGATTLGPYQPLDKARLAALPEAERQAATPVLASARQRSLAYFAVLPAIMIVCYLLLYAWFRSRGGYRAVLLGGGH
ncbi:MAG: MFS transporter [Gammaproteobacteria bacterium]|nr:MFS transporter [Gammaproteobacteria bacterium]